MPTRPRPTALQRVRLVLWIVAVLAAVAVPALLYMRSQRAAETSAGISLGGPFTLVDSRGQPYSSSRLEGRPHALFFGFTHCPDVCPTTLARLVRLRKTLGKGDDDFDIAFVTVDPERDTPEAVGQYMELFDAPVIGLTGSPEQIDKVKKLYGVYSAKVPQPGGEYTVDHTAVVYLFDRRGQFVGTIAPNEPDQAAIDKLKRMAA